MNKEWANLHKEKLEQMLKSINDINDKYKDKKININIIKNEESTEQSLGKYEYKNGNGHEITLYEKNILNKYKQLKDCLLKDLQYLAMCNVPWYTDRNHFPLEYAWARQCLRESDTFDEFIQKISNFLKAEFDYWNIKKKDSKNIELLYICDRELFDCIFEIAFLHQVGHLVHHLCVFKNYENFCSADNNINNIKEAFADLFALYLAPSLKEKIVFFSLAQNSENPWFNYYKKIYSGNNSFELNQITKVVNLLKEKVK